MFIKLDPNIMNMSTWYYLSLPDEMPVTRCQPAGAIPYWSEFPSFKLTGGYVAKSINIHSQSKCEEICMDNPSCRSVDYKDQLNDCEVNSADMTKESLEPASQGDTYLEWNCAKRELYLLLST